MSNILSAVEQLNSILNGQRRTKAVRPDLSVSLSKAESAQAVADLINSAWLTYGASPVEANEDGSYTFTISGQQLETFDGAMKYLWFKTQPKDPNTYVMPGLAYKVTAAQNGDAIEVTVNQ
jgi:hypothetical protein